ncbi:MAG: DUF2946 family protein [Burkholderiales bacterium]|nr:DUF2946 family protein [Burkholderiales bacterium]
MRSSFHRFAAWIALFAVLFAAVSPAVAAVRYLSDPIAFAEICRAGNAGAAADAQETPVPQPGAARQAHCIFCISGSWQASAVSVFVFDIPRVSELVLPVEGDAPRPYDSTAFSPSSPRAPPRLI